MNHRPRQGRSMITTQRHPNCPWWVRLADVSSGAPVSAVEPLPMGRGSFSQGGKSPRTNGVYGEVCFSIVRFCVWTVALVWVQPAVAAERVYVCNPVTQQQRGLVAAPG